MKQLLSVIVPCYNEEEALPYFYDAITKVSEKMDYLNFEYIFVNDGSKDKTLDIIREYAKKDKRVRYVSFSRNFGKEAGIMAGLKASKGDFVTLMDADLQDPPDLLEKMYKYIKEDGYDSVGTRRKTRKGEPVLRSFFAIMFYKIINKLSKVKMVPGARDYRLMTRQVVDAVLSLPECTRYSKGIFEFVGFKTKWISYDNIERVAGKSKWNFWSLFMYAIEGITAFSTAPLLLSALLGLFFLLLALIFIIVIIVKTCIYGDPALGWPSLVCIILFIGGIQLFMIGIIGQYLSKDYLEAKNRPMYIIKETEKDCDKNEK